MLHNINNNMIKISNIKFAVSNKKKNVRWNFYILIFEDK